MLHADIGHGWEIVNYRETYLGNLWSWFLPTKYETKIKIEPNRAVEEATRQSIMFEEFRIMTISKHDLILKDWMIANLKGKCKIHYHKDSCIDIETYTPIRDISEMTLRFSSKREATYFKIVWG